MNDELRAVVRNVNGKLVLDDPDALAMIRVVEAHNRREAKKACKDSFDMNSDRVRHFVGRIEARGLPTRDYVIVLLNMDDEHGQPLGDILMPGFDGWAAIREKGEIPFARGLASFEFIHSSLSLFDDEAATCLFLHPNDINVVVVDHGVAEVFQVK
mgnify:CR=1 FL=1